jgi:hypothetical protein
LVTSGVVTVIVVPRVALTAVTVPAMPQKSTFHVGVPPV